MAERDAARGRSFGEEGGLLTYGSYLRLPELLSQQIPQAQPPAHDELLFITVHQVYELWFKQLLFELASARDEMFAGRTWQARHLLRRVHAIERLLVAQVDILETMTPQDFLDFRATLAPASGFQSVQFRELEFLSGAKDDSFLARFRALTDAEKQDLNERLTEPTLWDGYVGLLQARGLATGDAEQLTSSLVTIARSRAEHDDLVGADVAVAPGVALGLCERTQPHWRGTLGPRPDGPDARSASEQVSPNWHGSVTDPYRFPR